MCARRLTPSSCAQIDKIMGSGALVGPKGGGRLKVSSEFRDQAKLGWVTQLDDRAHPHLTASAPLGAIATSGATVREHRFFVAPKMLENSA